MYRSTVEKQKKIIKFYRGFDNEGILAASGFPNEI